MYGMKESSFESRASRSDKESSNELARGKTPNLFNLASARSVGVVEKNSLPHNSGTPVHRNVPFPTIIFVRREDSCRQASRDVALCHQCRTARGRGMDVARLLGQIH